MAASPTTIVRWIRFDRCELLRGCARGDVDYLRKFAANHHDEKDFAVVDENGMGPLHHAVSSICYECVHVLLSTKLVNIHLKDNHSLTCLDVAIDLQVPCDIIRLLLQHDPNFFLIQHISGAERSAFRMSIYAISTELFETIIDTLHEMRFPFSKSFDFVLGIMSNLHVAFDTDPEKMNSIKTFEKMIASVDIEAPCDFMQRFCEVVLKCSLGACEQLLKSCVEKWHSAGGNQHHRLVRKLLDSPGLGFNYFVIFCLHSDLKSVPSIGDSYGFYQGIMACLLRVDIDGDHEHCIVGEAMDILWTKLDLQLFDEVYKDIFSYKRNDPKIFGKVTSVKWLAVLKVGDKINFDQNMPLETFEEVRIALNAFMPFSTEKTADAHLPRIRHRFDGIKRDYEQRIDEYRRRLVQRFDYDRLYSNALDCLQILDEDSTQLAEFCIEGNYRVKITLKSLCRAEIRKISLQSHGDQKAYSNFVKGIRSLELPKRLTQYLLFNYSEYNF